MRPDKNESAACAPGRPKRSAPLWGGRPQEGWGVVD